MLRSSVLLGTRAVIISIVFAACGGPTTPVGESSSAPVASAQSVISASPLGNTVDLPQAGGYSPTVTLPGNDATSSISIVATTSTTAPPTIPQLQNGARQTASVAPKALFYLSFVSPVTITFHGIPGFTVALPASVVVLGQAFYVAIYTKAGWFKGEEGPATVSGRSLVFPGNKTATLTLIAGQPYYFAFYGLPSSAPISANPTALTFFASGGAMAQTVAILESGYSGTFAPASSNCSGIASVAAQPLRPSRFVVTALAVGGCDVVFLDSNSNSVVVPIGVTTTQLGGH